MDQKRAFESGMLAARPQLHGYAMSLCRRPDQAEDLVQDTMLKALLNQTRFEMGTNMDAWLFTILRNTFHNTIRRRKWEAEDRDGILAARLKTDPAHHGRLEMRDFLRVFASLPDEQRSALSLVGALGHSYAEAAQMTGCAVGTIKSRVCRARTHLMNALDPEAAAAAQAVDTRATFPVPQRA